MPTRQRWIVDAIEGDVARVEIDGRTVQTVPVALLPAGVQEGSVLEVSWTRDGRDRARIEVRLDEAATAEALDRSSRQVAELRAASRERDPGGDVSL